MDKLIKKFDIWVNRVLLIFGILIFLMLLLGDRSFPKVISSNLKANFNPAELQSLQLNFNRLMDRKSVEAAFKIEPEMKGSFSWSGKNLAFTPVDNFEYGQKYRLTIAHTAHSQDGKELEKDYKFNFDSGKLQIGFVLAEGENANKIVFTDLAGKVQKSFTDGSFLIDKFIVTPDNQTIYFLARKVALANEGSELYQLNLSNSHVNKITNDSHYLNKNFSLSDDGKTMLLNRVEISDKGEMISRIEVWLADTADFKFKKYLDGLAQGIDSRFSPKGLYMLYRNKDSNYELAKSNAVLKTMNPGDNSVETSSDQDTLFVGEFSSNFGFHPFLPKIAFTEYDQQDVFSLNNKLLLFSGDGGKQYLPFDNGVVRDAVFSHDGKNMIVLFSGKNDDLTGKDALTAERLYHLYEVDLDNPSALLKSDQLTDDISYTEFWPQISADSRYVIFERLPVSDQNLMDPGFMEIQADLQGKKLSGDIWLLDLKSKSLKNLKVKGSNVIFLP